MGDTRRFCEYCLTVKRPKYLRLDSKPLEPIYNDDIETDFEKGFSELLIGEKIGIISTGYMTHTTLNVAKLLSEKGINIGVIDLFFLKSYDKEALYEAIKNFSHVITLEEAFIYRGGKDSSIADLLFEYNNSSIKLLRFGIEDKYLFEGGGREYLHALHQIDEISIAGTVESLV